MRKMTTEEQRSLGLATRLVTLGRKPDEAFGFVNTPPYRGSTVLYPDAEHCLAHSNRYTYGRRGNPTSEALETLWSELEGAAGTVICPSGAMACSTAMLSCLKAGDHVLVTDSVYRPTRQFCEGVLARFGVEVSYYDPLIGGDIARLFRPNTRAVYTESPGSQSFEVQDIPAIAAAARAHGALTLMDNTWATPLLFRPLDHGVDISIQAATKYPAGHSDVLIGLVAANERAWPALKRMHGDLGVYLGPDDVFLTLRGLRTMELRLREQGPAALTVAQWLQKQPQVLRVLHPALPDDPGHALWKRDFCGASGLFSAILRPVPREALVAFLDSLTLFGMGYSWGGFESLITPFDCAEYRSATTWNPGGPGIRLQIGLETPADLIADLAQGLARLPA
jgi:cystathionine beta-lyase